MVGISLGIPTFTLSSLGLIGLSLGIPRLSLPMPGLARPDHPFWWHFSAFRGAWGYPWEPFGCLWVPLGLPLGPQVSPDAPRCPTDAPRFPQMFPDVPNGPRIPRLGLASLSLGIPRLGLAMRKGASSFSSSFWVHIIRLSVGLHLATCLELRFH